MPDEDALPVLLDQGDELLDGLQAGAFRTGAPAAQVGGCVAGVLVVEGWEVLSPAPGPGGCQLGGGAHQLVELTLLLDREVRVVLEPQPAGVFELRASGELLAADGVDGLAELGGQVVTVMVVFGKCWVIPLMNAVLMSELVSATRSGSPPCSTRSVAKRATVSAERPSVAKTTRRASRSATMLTESWPLAAAVSSIPTRLTPVQFSWSRVAPTWCSTTRQTRVSCSRVSAASFAIGIAAAKLSTSASNKQHEPRPWARPGHADLPHPMLGTTHPRQPGIQQRPMLEKIQMPPRLVHRVMHRTRTLRAVLGRTPEPGPTIKTQIQIQLGGLGVEPAPDHPPRPAQPQRRHEQPQLIHTPATPSYATITDNHTANETITPSSTRHTGTTPFDHQLITKPT